jgi:hypothetical protein
MVARACCLLACQFVANASAAGADVAANPLERVRVSDDRTHFVLAESGRKVVVWGVNYDHDQPGRLIEDYWHDEWETVAADFREIKDLNANVVRVHLQLGRFMQSAGEPDERNLERLADLVKLAEETGLYLDLTGLGCYHAADVPAWYDALSESERWDVQARFWQSVAGVCQESPAIFCYDLMNEPIIGGDASQAGWIPGEFGGKHFVQRLTLDPAGRTNHEIAKAWVAKLCGAIREVDEQHLITVGVIPWALVFRGAKPLFYDPEVGEPLDFASVHFYPKAGEVDLALEALAVYNVGKPLVIEETFPLSCSLEEEAEFIRRSADIADGWVSFYWGTTIEESRQKGDLHGAIMASWLEWFRDNAPNE